LQSQEYTDAYNEIIAFGSDGISAPTERTDEQTEIGIYWGYDGQPGLGTPPRLYNQIAQEIAKQERNTEGENARMFALMNIAMADAGFTSWNNKYDDAFWRPVMGVRKGELDGNPETDGDADWTPLGAPASNQPVGVTNFTPPFPAYTSGHATFGAAAFQTLARFYGTDEISFSFVSDELNDVTTGADGNARPLIERSFDSLTQAKVENAQSRIYLGIHWRFDADDGIATGDAVADYVFENILEPRKKHGKGHGGNHHHGDLDRANGGLGRDFWDRRIASERPGLGMVSFQRLAATLPSQASLRPADVAFASFDRSMEGAASSLGDFVQDDTGSLPASESSARLRLGKALAKPVAPTLRADL
jgi:hypothetical protein